MENSIMTLQNNSLVQQEAAREAFNDYIQYLYVFGELEDNGGGNNGGDCEEGREKPSSSGCRG